MAISNQEGHLVLATGNKSELAVGYSTLYGDAVGAYAPLKDVSKTLVWQLARWRNDQASGTGATPPIPPNSITKPPSAELRPGQLDTDSLPDYAVLDDVLDDYVEQDAGAAELVAAGFPAELVEQVLALTDRAEYKRRQYPPGPEDLLQGVRARSPASHHQPVARTRHRTPDHVMATPELPPAPAWTDLADVSTALFLDIDGTLLEFEAHPELVRATKELTVLLESISASLGDAVALISGRPLDDIDRVFSPWQPFAAGGHGAEVRGAGGTRLHQPDADQLASIRHTLQDGLADLTGAWIEDKGYGFAVHYRNAPEHEDAVTSLAQSAASASNGTLEVQPGVLGA